MALHRNLIDGERVGNRLPPDINPSGLTEAVGDFASATAEEAQAAMAAARAAFPAWSRSGIRERARLLRDASQEILRRKDEIGALLSREEGKTLPEGIGETVRAAQILEFFSGEALRLAGEAVPSVRPGGEVQVTREPPGVNGIITPWNFPIAIPARKIAPALCCGTTIVVKPAELAPGCTWLLADILHRNGVPAGVLNQVTGKGSVLGQALLDGPDVDGISFTASVGTGRRVAEAAARHMRRSQIETGGKNPMIVLDGADLAVAVDAALAAPMQAPRVGHALETGTRTGPVVDAGQMKRDLDRIALGAADGARLVTGGEQVARETEGHFLTPALLADGRPDMRIMREEIFGPGAGVIRVADHDAALAVANGTEFGLSVGIGATSLKHAARFRRTARAGMVMINLPTAGVDFHVAFGGRKASSFGPREQGRHAAEFFTTVKTACTSAA